MSQHAPKHCPRCQQPFECKPGNITQCQCYGIKLSAAQQSYIEERYNDCLCRDCLLHLQQEPNLFREKYWKDPGQ